MVDEALDRKPLLAVSKPVISARPLTYKESVVVAELNLAKAGVLCPSVVLSILPALIVTVSIKKWWRLVWLFARH